MLSLPALFTELSSLSLCLTDAQVVALNFNGKCAKSVATLNELFGRGSLFFLWEAWDRSPVLSPGRGPAPWVHVN